MKRVAIILALVLLVAGAIFLRGRGRVLAQVDGEIRDLTVTGAGVFWIQAPAPAAEAQPGAAPATRGQAELRYVPRSGGRVLCLLREWDIRSLYVDGDRLHALVETGPEQDSGQLVVRNLRTGEEQRFKGLRRPQGIWAGGERMVWAEARDARAEAIVQVPIIRPVHVIRTGQTPDKPQLLTLTEGSQPHFSGRILGEDGGSLYWQESVGGEFSEGFTVIRRGKPDADPEAVVRTRGPNTSVLVGDRLWWTTYSEEKDRPSGGRAARNMKVQGDEPRTVTDWLPTDARLISHGSSVYCAGGGWLWNVPARLSEPTPIVRSNAKESSTAAVLGGNVYAVDTGEEGSALVRVPLSASGVLRAAFAFGGLNAGKVGAL